MTAKILPFKFKTTEVRTIEENDLIWFVASDVAKALCYRDAEKMSRILDDDEKATHIVGTIRGDQVMTTINESGLYHALLKSRKPEAKPFRKWVTAEVLPSIRKQGRYDAKPALPSTLTPAQQRHIQRLVANLAKLPGNSFQQVYRSIKDRFNVGSYKDVPADSYPALCKYLGGQPKNDPLAAFQLEQAPLEGDLLTGGTPGPAHELAANYPVTGQHWRHQYRDLMNCGWNDRISTFLFELSKHRGKTIALKVEDVDGLKKEVDSLKHMVESLHMHLERMRTSALSMADEAVWRG